MKKSLVLGGFLLVLGTEAGAQQLSNSDFEQGWEDCYPLDSYENPGETKVGSQPIGWHSANVYQSGFPGELVTKVEENGNTYVRMENKFVGLGTIGANAPGYLTLGQPWACANTKFSWSGISIVDADGGTYGGAEFTYRPDAISFKYKRSHGSEKTDEPFTVSAYSWNGTFTSDEKVGVPTKDCVMDDRDRVVLGTNPDAISSGKLIASVTEKIDGDASDWTEKIVRLNYNTEYSEEIPTKFNIIFSSADYYGDRNEIGAGNVLCIDDVKLIYDSDLKSLSYDGTPINIADPENIQIAAKNFDLSKVSCTSGKGADIQKRYDPAKRILTITIKGEDVLVNSKNQHEYSVNIVPPASEVTGTYNRWITVNMVGSVISESANNINIKSEEDGEVSFGLDRFLLDLDGSGPVNYGPVTIPNAKLSYAADKGIDIVTEEQNVLIEKLGTELPIILTAHLSESKKLTADLNIGEGFVIVNVGDVPFTASEENGILKVTGTVSKLGAASVKGTANVIDLTGATLAEDDLKTSDFSAEPNNTLYKISEAQTLDGNNVIQNGTCKNLVLTDGLTFNAPEAFDATNVTFNRKFTTGNLSTVVLPFSFDPADVNGTVYKLESVENGVLSFKSVEGMADANVPYLVKTKGDNLFKKSLTNAIVAQTPKTVENSIDGTGVTHVGNFGETMEITSDEKTSWYGYTSEGKFVKVSDGTIKPFRTAIKSTSATTQNSFALKLDGTVTGILNLENPNAKVDVYTVSGVCVRKNVPAASALNGLSRGVYIVGGQKVVK